jgi:nitrate/TMAO reductase-like tetraheme cytochrome c subunit
MVLTAALCLGILACIGLALVLYRGRQAEGTALWLHLVALGLLPLGLLAVGNFVVLEYSKEARFCGSCHVPMQPYLDDMQRPGSESLAALHFQHRASPGTDCYACHANYGLHGSFEAKLTGLQDVWRTYSRTYRLPIRMRGTFDNALCLKCHAGAKRFMAEAIHLEGGRVAIEYLNGKTECIQCHGPAHALPRPKRVARLPAPESRG